MKTDYYCINPTGNITLLVTGDVKADERTSVSALLMKKEKDAEQVGFVSGKALSMAGGEFCGNATLSAAALYCEMNGLDGFDDELAVSGAPDPVHVTAVKTGEHSYKGKVTMPRPLGISTERLTIGGKEYNLPVVKFPGIYHIITEDYISGTEIEKSVRDICSSLGAEALGVMYLDLPKYQITPLVYVPSGDTLVWENSCASGTSATGVYLSVKEGKPVSYVFREPGGTLGIEADGLKAPILSGRAEIIRRETEDITL